jgi:DNA-directed RNA polymerase specialized sigma24 family protein
MTSRSSPLVTDARSEADAVIASMYHENARALVGLARLFVDHRDAAEDVVQEAFIRFARSMHRLEDPAKATAYLRSIVLNLARDHNRRGLLSLRHRTATNDLDPSGVDETISDRHDHHQRDCLALHYLLELSVAEIAETLDVSVNSVKTHLKRGLAALRQQPDLATWIGEDA